MDKHTAHDIIHTYNGGKAENCPLCNGTIDDDQLMSEAKKIAVSNYKPQVNPNLPYNMRSNMLYDELSGKQRDNLEESSFAYIDSKGGKHLPIPDAAHVRNALARFNQTQFESDSAKSSAMAKIKAAAKKFGVDVNDDVADKNKKEASDNKKMYEGITVKDLFAADLLTFGEKGKLPDVIKIIPIGNYNTQAYGKVNITKKDLVEMADHFNSGVRAGVPIDIDHDQKAAAGWIKSVDVKDDGMYAEVEWTKLGEDKLGNKEYRFFSPEFSPHYVDPEHSFELSNVLIAGSLVNRPMFKELPALTASEKNLTNNKSDVMINMDQLKTDQKPMNVKDIIAKEKSTRTSEEQQFLADHKGELSFDEQVAEGFAEKKVEVKAAETENKDTVTIAASELKTLREQAENGNKAFSELQKETIRKEVKTMVFNEKGGKIAPAQVEPLTELMFTMSESQRETLKKIIESLPDTKIFGEEGSDEDTPATPDGAGLKLHELTKEKMASDKNLNYEAAQKIVASEHPELVKTVYAQATN